MSSWRSVEMSSKAESRGASSSSKYDGASARGSERQSQPCGITTFGEKIEAHDDSIKKETCSRKRDAARIRNFLEEKCADDLSSTSAARKKKIMVIHFNHYCVDDLNKPTSLVPAEFALGVFSINEGFLTDRDLTGLIDPVVVPVGLRSEVKETAEALGVPMIGKHAQCAQSFYQPANVMEVIEKWIKSFGENVGDDKCFFAFPDEIPLIERCFKWLNSRTELCWRREYKILSLTLLAMVLSDVVSKGTMMNNHIIRNEAVASRIMSYTQYDFASDLGCTWHAEKKNMDKVIKCSRNIVHRRIYNLLEYFCRLCKIKMTVPAYKPKLMYYDLIDHEEMEYQMRMHFTKFFLQYGEDEVARIIEQEPMETRSRTTSTHDSDEPSTSEPVSEKDRKARLARQPLREFDSLE